MATLEMTANQGRKTLVSSATESYGRPLVILTTLFFMWGFITCLNHMFLPSVEFAMRGQGFDPPLLHHLFSII